MNLKSLVVMLCTSFLCVPSPASAVQNFLSYSDPAGDSSIPGGLDVASVGSLVGPTEVQFRIEFYNAVTPASALATNSLVGYLDLDVDQNAATGAASHQNVFGGGNGAIGGEYFVDLFSEEFTPGLAEIVDAATMQAAATASLIFEPLAVTINVPLSALGGDSELNYGVAAGGFTAFSDQARDAGLPPATTVAEPAGGLALGHAAVIVWCVARRRSLSANTSQSL